MQLKQLPLLSIIIIFHTTPTLASLQEYRASLVSTAQQTDDRELASTRVAFAVDAATLNQQPLLATARQQTTYCSHKNCSCTTQPR